MAALESAAKIDADVVAKGEHSKFPSAPKSKKRFQKTDKNKF